MTTGTHSALGGAEVHERLLENGAAGEVGGDTASSADGHQQRERASIPHEGELGGTDPVHGPVTRGGFTQCQLNHV